MENAILIYNPTAGKEIIKNNLNSILNILKDSNFNITTRATEYPGDAISAASEAVKDFNIIIAAGGDGTLHEIINGIGPEPGNIKLGLIPAGTSNDFARALDIPLNIKKACEIIAKNKTKRIDIGSINERLFINIAGGGALTHISYEVPSKLKTYLGQLAYYAKGLEELPKLRPFPAVIETPEITIEEEIMAFLTANSGTFGGVEYLAPKARIDDGLLDIIVIKKLDLGDFINLAGKFLTGDQHNHPKITYFQSSKVEVSSIEEVSLNSDGEYAGKLPCTVKVKPRHINIISP